MVVTGTRAAFEALISERGIYKRLGVSISTVSTWKIYLREGKSISLDKMEEMLLKAAAVVVQEKVWEVNLLSGKDTFTQEEIDEINLVIHRIRSSGAVLQKKLRRYLRDEYDFYISDFEDSNGFTSEDLQAAIDDGKIKIVG